MDFASVPKGSYSLNMLIYRFIKTNRCTPCISCKRNKHESGLFDSFGRIHDYLRISVIDKCNFKCQYCYPQQIKYNHTPKNQLLTIDEIQRIINIFNLHGRIKKIRITGGEPLLRKDVISIVENINTKTDIKIIGLTTNAYYLQSKIQDLKISGLTNLNVSLDTLDAQKFAQITGMRAKRSAVESIPFLNGSPQAAPLSYDPERFNKVHETILRCIRNKEFPTTKINCVMMKGFNDEEILDFVQLTKDHDVCVRFIEYMPFLNNGWDTDKYLPYQEILHRIKSVHPTVVKCSVPHSETAKVYKIPGFEGTIGFITTMSQHFCGSCNRLRLTANGTLKNCIFGTAKLDLRALLRSPTPVHDDEIAHKIREFLTTKKKQHNESIQPGKINTGSHSLPMIQIGG